MGISKSLGQRSKRALTKNLDPLSAMSSMNILYQIRNFFHKLLLSMTWSIEALTVAEPIKDLETLTTAPNNRRRGAASLLLQHVMDEARSMHLPIYLQASQAGLPLYQKHGFNEIGKMEVDVSSISSDRVFNTCMIWDPRDLE